MSPETSSVTLGPPLEPLVPPDAPLVPPEAPLVPGPDVPLVPPLVLPLDEPVRLPSSLHAVTPSAAAPRASVTKTKTFALDIRSSLGCAESITRAQLPYGRCV